MAILKIARLGHPVLLGEASPAGDPTTPEMRRLIADMAETMVDANGPGLAAPQVHVPLRLFVYRQGGGVAALVDPVIEPVGEDLENGWEGCLSIPGQFAEVTRPARVRVRYEDLEGKRREVEAEGLHSACLQHEIDHLDGVMFFDHISTLKRHMMLRKFTKEQKLKARA